MSIDPTSMPENIRRCIAPADRRELGKAAMTNEDVAIRQAAESERQLQQNISTLFRLRGIVAFYQRMDKRTRGPVGTPDFLCAIKGKACAFEIKLPGEKPTPEQSDMHAAMTRDGWIVRIIHSEQEFKDAMNELEAG